MAKKAARKVARKTATSKKGSKAPSNAPKAKLVKKVSRKTGSGKGSSATSSLKSTGTKPSEKPEKSHKFDPRSVATFNDLPEERELSLIGLVAPDGSSGGGMEGQTWTYSTSLIAWKVKGGTMVREPALVVCRNVSERRLDSMMESVSSLDIVSFTAKRPNKSLRPKSYMQPVRFELTRFGRKSVDAELLSLKTELQVPVDFHDTVFGTLKLDRQSNTFRTSSSFRGTKMSVSFETIELDELKELIQYAKSLWNKRQAWFTNWQKQIYQYYKTRLSGWWEEDYELTDTIFYKLLGWPVGIEFSCEDGEFEYCLGGWSEELFTDHGIDVFGSTIDEMEVIF